MLASIWWDDVFGAMSRGKCSKSPQMLPGQCCCCSQQLYQFSQCTFNQLNSVFLNQHLLNLYFQIVVADSAVEVFLELVKCTVTKSDWAAWPLEVIRLVIQQRAPLIKLDLLHTLLTLDLSIQLGVLCCLLWKWRTLANKVVLHGQLQHQSIWDVVYGSIYCSTP